MIRFGPLTEAVLAGMAAEERGGLIPSPVDFTQVALSNPCGAMFRGRKPIAAAGLLPFWPGTASAWAFFDEHATRRELVMMVRRCRAELDRLQARPEWARVEMRVLADAPWARSFARALGMRQEGYLQHWDSLGRDYLMFARIAKCAVN